MHAHGGTRHNVFGWQKPCYLLQEGYAKTFRELIETTRVAGLRWKNKNEKCADCMVHCGYEASARRGYVWKPDRLRTNNEVDSPAHFQ